MGFVLYRFLTNGWLEQIIKVHNRNGVTHNYPLGFANICVPVACVLRNDHSYARTVHIATYSLRDIKLTTRWTNEQNSGVEDADVVIRVCGF